MKNVLSMIFYSISSIVTELPEKTALPWGLGALELFFRIASLLKLFVTIYYLIYAPPYLSCFYDRIMHDHDAIVCTNSELFLEK